MRGGRAWSCAAVVRGRARRSCAAVVCGRARSVVRGRAWSSLTAVLPASRPALPCCPLRGQRCRDARKDGHTRDGQHNYNTPLNPPGVGWVKFFYPINVIVSGSKKLPFKFNNRCFPLRCPQLQCSM